ncbi:hypothetical protein [Vibrio sp. FJH11]
MNIHVEVVFGIMLVLLVVWLTPLILVLKSTKTHGSEKLGWLLAIVFISWFAWIFYLLLAPIKANTGHVRE